MYFPECIYNCIRYFEESIYHKLVNNVSSNKSQSHTWNTFPSCLVINHSRGYLMAEYYKHAPGTKYMCVDSYPDTLLGGID